MAYTFVAASSQSITTTDEVLAAAYPFTVLARFSCASDTGTALTLVSTSAASPSSTMRTRMQARWDVANNPISIAQTTTSNVTATATTTTFMSTATWMAASGVFASNASRTVQLDAAGGNTNTTSNNINPLPVQIATQYILGAASNFFDGSLADVGVWKATLTDAEIASYVKGFPARRINPQTLVYCAPLVRDVMSLIKSISHNGPPSLTINNSPTVSDHPRIYGF